MSQQHDDHLTRYLLGLARLCCEVAYRPWLLPWFVQVIARVPATIMELRREARRLAVPTLLAMSVECPAARAIEAAIYCHGGKNSEPDRGIRPSSHGRD
jgi:hypothetical protein